jgi:ATP-dependent Clp protease protease subunit
LPPKEVPVNEPPSRPNEARLQGEEEEEDKGHARLPDSLETKLLDSRTILVEGAVTDRMYRTVSARLLYLEHQDPQGGILMLIHSPGGAADTGFGIYDLMRFVRCPIKTVCAGLCASAAVLIYLGGRKGQRYALPNSRFLLHQPSTTTFGPASDMEITAKEILRTRRRYAEVVAQEIGVAAEKVIEDSNRDFWLDAQEGLKYGLVDKIIKNREEL